jgi:hypothetical protein
MSRSIWVVALAFALHACAPSAGDDDPQLTPDELATLPDSEAVHENLIDAVAPPGDTSDRFDTDAVPDGDDPDIAVVDDDVDPASPQIIAATAPLLHWGMMPRASNAMRRIGIPSWRVLQTIGSASASAGTHAQDGTINGLPYCSATDLSVSGLSDAEIRNLLGRLAGVGFAAWFRNPGHDGWPIGSAFIRHIHAVYANSRMKTSLQSQVRSWFDGRTGLVGNAIYTFFKWSAAEKADVRAKWVRSDFGTTNGGSTCVVGGRYCGGDKISGNTNDLYRCTGTGSPTLVQSCGHGCEVRSGEDDVCR